MDQIQDADCGLVRDQCYSVDIVDNRAFTFLINILLYFSIFHSEESEKFTLSPIIWLIKVARFKMIVIFSVFSIK